MGDVSTPNGLKQDIGYAHFWTQAQILPAQPRSSIGWSQNLEIMICFWCHAEVNSLTDDHIIPYSLGGTADCTVKSCVHCQNRLSKAEHEVARKSMLAIHALTAPVAPRHPERPTSGHLKPEYFMVIHPEGGYGETLFSAGERASLLPYFEIKVVPGEPLAGRVRGTTEGARRLLDVFRRGLKNTPGPDRFLFEINVSCDLDRSISDDKDFWPRICCFLGIVYFSVDEIQKRSRALCMCSCSWRPAITPSRRCGAQTEARSRAELLT